MNKLTFGLGKHHEPEVITMGVPEEVAEASVGGAQSFSTQLRLAQELGVASAQTTNLDGDLLVEFYLAKIGQKRSPENKRLGLMAVTRCIESFSLSSYAYSDPALRAELYTEPTFDGRLGMLAEIRWPEQVTDDQALAQLATSAMVAAGKALRYMRDSERYPGKKMNLDQWKRHIEKQVYARVDRERGVILQSWGIGSCSLDTDGMNYEPVEPTFEVRAHNIYSPEQQLICLAGAVAIANADELATV